MSYFERLSTIAEQLAQDNQVEPVTVREFLSWFGAQRRGTWIVARIRWCLESFGLRTVPDFESAYIGSWITFEIAPATPTSKTEDTTSQLVSTLPPPIDLGEPAPATPPSYADPTYRLSKLAAANRIPTYISPDGTLEQAVTIMLTNDFSQVPVMTNARDVKGVISWQSIGSRLALGKTGSSVRDFVDIHQEIRADASLFQAIPIIVAYQYVLVRGQDNTISGIVTASDLSLQFQQLAEPFLLLGEIENHIRRILGGRFSAHELSNARDEADSKRPVTSVADLTFGEYIRLFENPTNWAKLGLAVDRSTFCKALDRVRQIRNDVMHFDPDGIPPNDLERLRDITRFLQQLHVIGIT